MNTETDHTISEISFSDLIDAITPWLNAQRWFPRLPHAKISLTGEMDMNTGDYIAEHHVTHLRKDIKESQIRNFLINVNDCVIQVPLMFTTSSSDDLDSSASICHLEGLHILDAVYFPQFWRKIVKLAQFQGTVGPEQDSSAQKRLNADLLNSADNVHVFSGEQSNTSACLTGDHLLVMAKLLRVISPGLHPDLDTTLTLTQAHWVHVPTVIGYVSCLSGHQKQSAVTTILSEFIPDATDGFQLFIDLARDDQDPRERAQELGKITREMHELLAHHCDQSASPTPDALIERINAGLEACASEVYVISPALLDSLKKCVKRLNSLEQLPNLTRIHGDYHLGQTLFSATNGWTIIDFEGEPLRPLDQRTKPDLPLRDVAGMMRSFDYAMTQAKGLGYGQEGRDWVLAAETAFLSGYTDNLDDDTRILIDALLIEKAAYETVYEFRMRPDWQPIPLAALERFVETDSKN